MIDVKCIRLSFGVLPSLEKVLEGVIPGVFWIVSYYNNVECKSPPLWVKDKNASGLTPPINVNPRAQLLFYLINTANYCTTATACKTHYSNNIYTVFTQPSPRKQHKHLWHMTFDIWQPVNQPTPTYSSALIYCEFLKMCSSDVYNNNFLCEQNFLTFKWHLWHVV